jgi:hypothetical protein
MEEGVGDLRVGELPTFKRSGQRFTGGGFLRRLPAVARRKDENFNGVTRTRTRRGMNNEASAWL